MTARLSADALHATRADRLATGLFDRVEDRAGVRALRHVLRMHPLVVAGDAQRHGVAERPRVTAMSRAVILRGGSGSRAEVPERPGRSVENDLQFRLAGDGAHGQRHRPLERLGVGAVVARLCWDVVDRGRPSGPQLMTTLAADSGSSSPKQRW
jgi:hypothetical protein